MNCVLQPRFHPLKSTNTNLKNFRTPTAILLCAFFSVNAFGQITNSGNLKSHAGANLNILGNFVNNGNMVDSGLMIEFSDSNAQSIGGTSIVSFNNLRINNSSSTGVTLLQKIMVHGRLTLDSGLLNTNDTHMLIMENNSVTASGSSASLNYVNGPMVYHNASSGVKTLNFPIGKVPDSRPLVLTLNHSNGQLYKYRAESFNADANAFGYTMPPTVNRLSKFHYWMVSRADSGNQLQPVSGLNGNQTIEVFFGTNDNVMDGGSLTICKSILPDTSWIDIGGSGAPAYNAGAFLAGSIRSTSTPSAFNSFSAFTLGNLNGGINPLPIDLLSFTARPDHQDVVLEWTTTHETNNKYFDIERSADGFAFEKSGAVNAYGDGNSDHLQVYAAMDEAPLRGTSFYRLKQVDIDGNYKYSRKVNVSFDGNRNVLVFPNPASGMVRVVLPENFISGRIVVTDVSGKELLSYDVKNSDVQLDVSVLAPGVYFLTIEDDTELHSIHEKVKLLIQ